MIGPQAFVGAKWALGKPDGRGGGDPRPFLYASTEEEAQAYLAGMKRVAASVKSKGLRAEVHATIVMPLWGAIREARQMGRDLSEMRH